jgi:hypothetical protein
MVVAVSASFIRPMQCERLSNPGLECVAEPKLTVNEHSSTSIRPRRGLLQPAPG